jgi:membrane protease YdiL (CAAX protease family)
MQETISASRRITILIGLALALGVASFAGVLHLPVAINIFGLPQDLVQELFWWGLTALVLTYVLAVERRPLASIGWRRPDWKTLAFGVGAGVFALITVGSAINILFPLLHLKQNAAALKQLAALPLWQRALIVLRAGVCEEVLFRGYGMERIRELSGSRLLAALVTLACFTFGHLAHWGWVQLIVAAAAGSILTALYLWRRDLGTNIVMHWFVDGVSVLLGGH